MEGSPSAGGSDPAPAAAEANPGPHVTRTGSGSQRRKKKTDLLLSPIEGTEGGYIASKLGYFSAAIRQGLSNFRARVSRRFKAGAPAPPPSPESEGSSAGTPAAETQLSSSGIPTATGPSAATQPTQELPTPPVHGKGGGASDTAAGASSPASVLHNVGSVIVDRVVQVRGSDWVAFPTALAVVDRV